MPSKADEMFRRLGWKKVSKPHELEMVFNDCYSAQDTVYEYYHRKQLKCRLYFIKDVYGYSFKDVAMEFSIKEHLAIHEKMKELGWINEQDK